MPRPLGKPATPATPATSSQGSSRGAQAPAPRLRPGAPVGVLWAHADRSRFRHARYLPAADLAAHVEHVWVVRWDLRGLPPFTQETLPHPSVHLVVEAGHSGLFGVPHGRFTKHLEGRGRGRGQVPAGRLPRALARPGAHAHRAHAAALGRVRGAALEQGFYDQAHFVRSFTALVGLSPGAYVRRLAATQGRGPT